ncbi:MAG: CehA/McbA family metallohydrolase [Thermoleophilaceae bacterium]|nr:CehA/McbA family metallohydrolase [Thermoleophilaceae bacterium]
MRRPAVLLALAAVALTAPAASAQAPPQTLPAEPGAGLTTPCGGRSIAPDQVLTGEFGTNLNKDYVLLPFDVPRGTTAVRVKYCWDRPESGSQRHTLDLGLYEPRRGWSRLWGEREFRGWGGSSHPDVTLSAEGFSSEADYEASPRVEIPGKTTRGFIPGPVQPGRWAAELGVAAVIPQSEGDADGKVKWRVEIELSEDPAYADEPYRPARYDSRPARSRAGWYAGDMHVHAEHSNYGAATMTESFDYAFRPLAEGGAGLDFITLSDYVSSYPAWNEVGRYQPRYPKHLIVRSAEVITYRGHTNNHASGHYVDYRTTPVYERRADGSFALLSPGRPPRDLFREVHRYGGWTQINHPKTFEPTSPAVAALCRGCYWEYTPEQTDYSQVDAYELANGFSELGTSPNPFTPLSIAAYDALLGQGHRIAAVGSSDSHEAGRAPGVLDAPIGEATTVVYARELSERGIRCGVQGLHTYVKVTGNAGPDLRFTARPWGNRRDRAIIGDVVRGNGATFRVRLDGASGRTLQIIKDGVIATTVPITSDDFRYRFDAAGPGRWRLQVMRGAIIETVSSPIWVKPGWGPWSWVDSARCR